MKKLLTAFLFSVLVLVPAMTTFAVGTYDPTGRNTGLIFNNDRIANVDLATGDENSARVVIASVLNFVLFFLGILTTGMVIYGGFLYITAAGDDGKTETGKNIMTFSAIGIVIIFISFALVNTFLSVADPLADGDPGTLTYPSSTGAGGTETETETE